MSTDKPTADDIEEAAGTEDEDGVIQPSLDEIMDPDPEHAPEDAGDEDETED